MKPQGYRSQMTSDFLYSADGTITAGGTSQLVVPRAKSRSYLFFQNLSSNTMYVAIGGARATATVSGGVVTGFTIANGGFGYVKTPTVRCFGGGASDGIADTNCGGSLPDWPSPSRPAQGLAVLSGGVLTSITITDPGSGYLRAPYVLIESNPADSIGCEDPFYSSTARGFQILPAGSLEFFNQCPTDAVAVYGTTTGDRFTCRYMY